MSLRIARVNELVKREIASYLTKRYGAETVCWTITSVEVAADLRNAKVAYSVLGDELSARKAQQFFQKHAGEIRGEVSKYVVYVSDGLSIGFQLTYGRVRVIVQNYNVLGVRVLDFVCVRFEQRTYARICT